ncbi:hypothetical protein PSTT_08170 [Puccinia striiformis]|uniref:Uncharacterized protein n=1 Tax=Puccinia striiformis TaxID=27350 RepID=A0A2S4VDK6_9BASI|nr:hypothetical protein PSTT_08170 [Puccinia striiformis]
MTMFASRALFSSVLCVIVAAVTAFRQAPDGPLNLCSGSGTNSMVVGALYSNGTVSRVSGRGQLLDTPSGHCSCVANGVYCPVHPSNPLFRGPLVFCANTKTNKCFSTVEYNFKPSYPPCGSVPALWLSVLSTPTGQFRVSADKDSRLTPPAEIVHAWPTASIVLSTLVILSSGGHWYFVPTQKPTNVLKRSNIMLSPYIPHWSVSRVVSRETQPFLGVQVLKRILTSLHATIPQNLCRGSGTSSMVVGALYSNGTVSRVSGQGQSLDTPSGHCSCVTNGVYCPVPPSNPLFRGPLVFCANAKTNKCFKTVAYNPGQNTP